MTLMKMIFCVSLRDSSSILKSDYCTGMAEIFSRCERSKQHRRFQVMIPHILQHQGSFGDTRPRLLRNSFWISPTMPSGSTSTRITTMAPMVMGR